MDLLGRVVTIAVVYVAHVVLAFEVGALFPFIIFSTEFVDIFIGQSVEDSASCPGKGNTFRNCR